MFLEKPSNTELPQQSTITDAHDRRSKSKKRRNRSNISNHAQDRTGRKKRQHVKHVKSSKKTKRHEPVINDLLQQGWSVLNKNRYQITVVKMPEAETNLKITSLQKATSITKKSDKVSLRDDNQVGVPVGFGESHEKKNLLQKFVRRSQKVIERFFTRRNIED